MRDHGCRERLEEAELPLDLRDHALQVMQLSQRRGTEGPQSSQAPSNDPDELVHSALVPLVLFLLLLERLEPSPELCLTRVGKERVCT